MILRRALEKLNIIFIIKSDLQAHFSGHRTDKKETKDKSDILYKTESTVNAVFIYAAICTTGHNCRHGCLLL